MFILIKLVDLIIYKYKFLENIIYFKILNKIYNKFYFKFFSIYKLLKIKKYIIYNKLIKSLL